MKKLIVIGIAAMMVMGLAAAPSAAFVLDSTWAINLQAFNQADSKTQGPAIFGTKSGVYLPGPPEYFGATNGYTQVGTVQTGITDGFKSADGDALLAPMDPGMSLIGVYTRVLKQGTTLKSTAGDIRAPLVFPADPKDVRTWQFYVTGGGYSLDTGSTNFVLKVSKPADAQWANDGTVQVKIYSVGAFGGARTLLWDSAVTAASSTPLLIWTSPLQEANAGSYKFEMDAMVPEPGSILALASGLVGLIGFGIRRRK